MDLFKTLRDETKKIESGLTQEKGLADMIESGLSYVNGGGIGPTKATKVGLRSATGWVYACVDVISQEIGSIELKLFEVKGKENIDEVIDDRILDVLARANNATTKFDLFYLSQQYLELAGEAPWFIAKDTDNLPSQIVLLRPDNIAIVPGDSENIVGGYIYKIVGKGGYKEIKLDTEEVVFIKNPDPVSPFRGKGTLQAVADTFALDESSEKYNAQLMKSGAAPFMTLSTDKSLTKETLNRLKKEVKRNYEGVENAGKTMILEKGLKAEPLSMTNRDMQFMEQQKYSRDKILAIFRVPRTVLGITDDVNRANAEATDYVFAKRTIKPRMQRLIEQLNEFFIPMFDDKRTLFLDYEDPVPENRALDLTTAEKGKVQNILTTNEARNLIGFSPIDGGDELAEEATANQPKKFKLHNAILSRAMAKYEKKSKVKKVKDTIEQTIASEVSKKMLELAFNKSRKDKKKKKKFKKKAILRIPKTQDEKYAFQEKQLTVEDEYEEKVNKILGIIFGIQKRLVLDSLPKEGKIKIKDLLLDVQKQIELYEQRLTPTFGSLITDQSKLAGSLVGFIPNMDTGEKITRFSDVTRKFLKFKLDRMALEVTRDSNKRLRKALQEGIEQGESIPQISNRITELFVGMAKTRSTVIARTEVSRATNFATEETYKDSGVVEGKEWLTEIDERTDDACLALNGKIVELDQAYFKKGDSFHGLNLNYETVLHPPLHPNCRCTLIPVLKRL